MEPDPDPRRVVAQDDGAGEVRAVPAAERAEADRHRVARAEDPVTGRLLAAGQHGPERTIRPGHHTRVPHSSRDRSPVRSVASNSLRPAAGSPRRLISTNSAWALRP
ncbi:hypothetical protein ACWENO_05100 [Streptomyces sp. NPDC004436]